MTKRPEQISKAYKKSLAYDRMMSQKPLWARSWFRLAWGFDDIAYAAPVLSFIPEGFSGRMLDVPVGTGILTSEKYRSLPDAEIVALDYSEDMLAVARKRFMTLGLRNTYTVRGDIGELPFKGNSFDLVLSMNGFHVFPDKERAFSEVARVLKSGGIFCGCFYVRGKKRRTDFFVRTFMVPGGWFTPPFFSIEEVMELLTTHYDGIELHNLGAIVYFKGIKR
jgi:SAM-dependent methyltransferase